MPEATLADLRFRLGRTRWADPIPDIGWDQGIDLDYLKELVAYWATSYDWRAAEQRLNSFDHFSAEVEGQPIRFLHVRSPHRGAAPLVVLHGWPGSIAEFLDTIPLLVDPSNPEDAFDLVIPSLPGYGFSAPVVAKGWNPRRIGKAFGTVMAGLGYEHYGVQGGDIGSMVACHMADLFPANVTGLHVNFLAFPDLGPPDMSSVRPEVRAKVGLGGGYGEIQRTRPQSIGFLLDDSPAGLAGWIVDKFREWSDCKGDIEQSFTKDQLLTNIMIYWINGAGTSAARLYWEIREFGSRVPSAHISVPTGVANFPAEVAKPQRENVAERFNLVHWTELPRGGHFAAMEEPEFFAQDVRTFFRLIR